MVSGYSTLVQFQSGTRNFMLFTQTLTFILYLQLVRVVYTCLSLAFIRPYYTGIILFRRPIITNPSLGGRLIIYEYIIGEYQLEYWIHSS